MHGIISNDDNKARYRAKAESPALFNPSLKKSGGCKKPYGTFRCEQKKTPVEPRMKNPALSTRIPQARAKISAR
jgi:hypothetical protein